MCKYVVAKTVMPGYGCCQCRTYNGLQRQVLKGGVLLTQCKEGCTPGCELVINDPNLMQCSYCFAGYKKDDGIPKRNLAGTVFNPDNCIVCEKKFIPLGEVRGIGARNVRS